MAQGYNLNPIQGDLYSAGNVQFDPTPYVRYSLEVQARNRARDDAFARAFQDLGARVTPAGMDGLDIDNFMKRKKEWQDYVIKNEKAYKNPALDDGQVYGEAMRRYNNILSVQQNSLDKLERLKPLRAIYADPTKRALITEQTIMDAQRGMLPVNHPDYKPFDPNSIKYNPEPFSQTAANSYLDQVRQNVTGEKVYGKERIDPKTKSKYSPFTITINPKDYEIIRSYAANLSGSDPSAARFFDQELNNPQDYQKHNEIYKKYFGQKANIQSREDMATAWTLGLLDLESKGEEKSTYSPTNINVSGGAGTNINDVGKLVTDYLTSAKYAGAKIVPVISLPSEAREAIITSVNKGRSEKQKVRPEKMNIVLADNGNFRIVNMSKNGDVVADISPTALNLMINTAQKQEQSILNSPYQNPMPTFETNAPQPKKKFKNAPPGGF